MENLDAGDRQIAMYLRISNQDRTGSKECSIEHQKKMILNWLHDQQFLQEEENVPQKSYLGMYHSLLIHTSHFSASTIYFKFFLINSIDCSLAN